MKLPRLFILLPLMVDLLGCGGEAAFFALGMELAKPNPKWERDWEACEAKNPDQDAIIECMKTKGHFQHCK